MWFFSVKYVHNFLFYTLIMSDISENLSIQQILHILPHRSPFLLLDRIVEVLPNERAVAYKNISFNEPWAQGHFPNRPVFPGVLILEAMAQVCVVLGYYSLPKEMDLLSGNSEVLFGGADKVRVRRKVIPGDRLTVTAHFLKSRLNCHKFRCTAHVDSEPTAESDIICFFNENASNESDSKDWKR